MDGLTSGQERPMFHSIYLTENVFPFRGGSSPSPRNIGVVIRHLLLKLFVCDCYNEQAILRSFGMSFLTVCYDHLYQHASELNMQVPLYLHIIFTVM